MAVTLPLTGAPVTVPSGGVPPFFAGLLPEGHRLTVLKDAVKASLDDELSLLLAVGDDAPGDVQVVPVGEAPVGPEPLADSTRPQELDFTVLAAAVDLHALPGVQDKASASVLTAPLATRGSRLILKPDPPRHPHRVENEALHLTAAKGLRIPVTGGTVVIDRHGRPGLLVERFDRVRNEDEWVRLPLEDAAQIMGLPPAAKYNVSFEDAVLALAAVCQAPVIAARNLYLQFVFAWLTGNGDLHAKNVSALGDRRGGFVVAPVYDVPCALLYGDDSQALPVDEVLAELAALEDPRVREVNERRGDHHGVNLGKLRAIAKRLRTQQDLAQQLWETGDTAARLLALLTCSPKASEGVRRGPKAFERNELDAMVREARPPKVHDWLVNYVVQKNPHAEELRLAWSADPDPVVASAGWALTTERVAKKPEGLDLTGLLDVIEAGMQDAPDRLQWAMNSCLAQIGIEPPAHRARALDIGERLEVLKDCPRPPNCTSPFAPVWITEMVRRRNGGGR